MVTRDREFLRSKRAGRNVSDEPVRSLVNKLEKSILRPEGEDRWMGAEITELASSASGIAGASCSGRFIVLEDRYGEGEAIDCSV